jgi:ankyrin repeat protein
MPILSLYENMVEDVNNSNENNSIEEHTNQAKLLLEENAELHKDSNLSKAVLLIAAYMNDVESIHFLCNKGVDMNSIDENEDTALHKGAVQESVEAMIALVEGCVISPSADLNANPRANPRADLNAKNNDGNTPLHLAVNMETNHSIEYLLEAGAIVDLKNNDGDTPLHIAAREGNIDVVSQLRDRYADPNITNNDGDTPLHISGRLPDNRVTIELLATPTNGTAADLTIVNNDGLTPQVNEN